MIKHVTSWLIAVFAFLCISYAAADSDIEYSSPSYTLFHEFGSFVSGLSENIPDRKLDNEFIHRSGAWFDFSATKAERLKLLARIARLFSHNSFYEKVLQASGQKEIISTFKMAEMRIP